MASEVCEGLAFIKGDDGLQINGALLMSLMEESSPSDEGDDERLNSLIRAFEAEISGSKKMEDDDDSASSTGSERFERNDMEECGSESWKMEEIEWCNSSNELWVDMDLVSSCPFEDRSWCFDPCGEEHYVFPNNYMGDHNYNSLWQDMPCN
ncbi:uncharacterized protein LOC106761548 [Vigna radiata var. radiata]|uniref:Uncharacterized protein LOC106761548 n=1 Tax=Vigna radiata var. radiata TaxID=3916 RepID=A0A1S3U3J4_VIGRR|nr:uncharacterized protein LOC106761548 [Vigna radiata var. radiata]